MNLSGMRYLGDLELLEKAWRGTGVFASRTEDSVVDIAREQWAISQGRFHKCVLGTFHSRAECEILYFVLKNGGSAIWFLGCGLPQKLSPVLTQALNKKRLLMVSCFHREHHNQATARYCLHLVMHYTRHLVFWSPTEKGLLQPLLQRAQEKNYRIEVF